ncbi:TetR/AcrR family transcriptional regulator [Sciscionella marina]|uniref:TetR/AcrR family transcriptional regulator n=1 Tax=Sciscionella marina TaxID=508770 RepID=UPI000381733C|nr:TetR/AcrR family transcriptional regulator [Sciscionella marina]
MSQRRNTLEPANAIPEEQILDAAYELLLGIGVRRMTMSDIARASGVSRATLYRRWSDVRQVVAALMTREWARLGIAAQHGEVDLAEELVRVVRQVRAHPMLQKIIALDPEVLLPYLVRRRGTTTTAQLGTIEAALTAGAERGTVRAGDQDARAKAVLLTAWSFTLTGPVLAETEAELTALDEELRQLLTRYLTP